MRKFNETCFQQIPGQSRVLQSALLAVCIFSVATSVLTASAAQAKSNKVISSDHSGSALQVRFDGSGNSGWLPFRLHRNSHIIFPVIVNGKKVDALLDSGASVTVIDQGLVHSLALREVRAKGTGGGYGGGAAYSDVYGSIIRLGRLTIANSETVGVDESQRNESWHLDVPITIGGAAFSKTIVDIDFPHSRLRFIRPRRYSTPGKPVVARLFPAGDNRAFDVDIDGKSARVEFDLGNGSPLVLHSRYWRQESFLKGRSLSSTQVGGFGGTREEGLLHLACVNVAGLEFSNVPANLSSASDASIAETDGNVGLPLLKNFHLITDFPHSRLPFFQKNTPAKTSVDARWLAPCRNHGSQ